MVVAIIAVALANSYGGEIILRVFLFADPALAFLAATLFFPSVQFNSFDQPNKQSRWVYVAVMVVSIVFLAGFSFGYYGKENQYRFTTAEQEVADYMYETAPDNALIVVTSHNYPAQFKNYDKFYYVTIQYEPAEVWGIVGADPANVLADWMRDFSDGYFLITDSQIRELDALGMGPEGYTEAIERALAKSPLFELEFSNEDGKLYSLTEAAMRR